MTTKGIKVQDDAAMKAMLHRIVAMLTRMAIKFDGVAESKVEYDAEIDYDYEHRYASMSTIPERKKYQNHGMQRSGRGKISREISAKPSCPLKLNVLSIYQGIESR